ncbi:alpha/beta fold hydrolase [Streptomyces sp. AV19]|uniref:thioesterase II family protein n=1 Tax=Streptomyces sp. AV19 TaxID=2793068 RepID=UPI0018FE9F74|nr:alpha/beta fold hydrolase [Streptomyces sp. AV19]MBH1933516.1 alpha/beta fold hydrolase [Streptomyces sp. AV19]MDG4532165.1 alpha/beta fold hydrolase [Streptomyces sp. AV19]
MNGEQPVRLYCFPHAGATSVAYRPWKALGTDRLTIVAVDQPGRGTRRRETRTEDFRQLVESTAAFVADDLRRAREETPGARWATFGHSFGATLSLAVAAAVERAVGEAPVRAFLSAALPPGLQKPDDTDALSDEQLLEKIAADGGTARELLSNSAMSAFLVRLMREDYVVRRQFPQEAGGLRVGFPLTLIAARDDVYVTPGRMWRWAEHSEVPARRVEIDGGHFAAVQEPAAVVAIVGEDIGEGER